MTTTTRPPVILMPAKQWYRRHKERMGLPFYPDRMEVVIRGMTCTVDAPCAAPVVAMAVRTAEMDDDVGWYGACTCANEAHALEVLRLEMLEMEEA